MKKLFDKLSKIVFVFGIIALIILLLVVVNSSNDTIEGMQGIVLLICLVVILVFCIFAIVSVILAVVEGLKRDKVSFLKKFLSNAVLITIAYFIPYVLDCFNKLPISINFEFERIVLRIFVTALAYIGGEYMITDHSKEDTDELHF